MQARSIVSVLPGSVLPPNTVSVPIVHSVATPSVIATSVDRPLATPTFQLYKNDKNIDKKGTDTKKHESVPGK